MAKSAPVGVWTKCVGNGANGMNGKSVMNGASETTKIGDGNAIKRHRMRPKAYDYVRHRGALVEGRQQLYFGAKLSFPPEDASRTETPATDVLAGVFVKRSDHSSFKRYLHR
jgi:hypothetical protein